MTGLKEELKQYKEQYGILNGELNRALKKIVRLTTLNDSLTEQVKHWTDLENKAQMQIIELEQMLRKKE